MSHYLKAQQKLIDSAFAKARPATSPRSAPKPAARKAPARRSGAR